MCPYVVYVDVNNVAVVVDTIIFLLVVLFPNYVGNNTVGLLCTIVIEDLMWRIT